jgi:hypothetical protein
MAGKSRHNRDQVIVEALLAARQERRLHGLLAAESGP